jgi:hypothetical protein
MKTIKITYNKDAFQAVCVMRYIDGNRPFETEWSGDVDVFRLKSGGAMDPRSPLFSLKENVEFQSAQAGAEFTIEDDGGEVRERGRGVLVSDGGGVDVYTATFNKGEYQATCELRYWGGADQPMRNEWTGDEEAYHMPDGSPFEFRFPQEAIERELASQCKQIGAKLTIDHRIIK